MILDLVALSIQSLAVRWGPALGSRWNARRDAASGESLSECITIVALVGNKRLGVWQHWIDQSRAGWRDLHLWSPGGFLLEALTPAGSECVRCVREFSRLRLHFGTGEP